MNIGTFKATGLSNSESINIYFGIINRFTLIAIVSGLIVSFIVGQTINFILISNIANDDEMKYFNLFEVSTILTIFLIFVSSFVLSRSAIRRILSKSPGDLIYNR